MHNGMHNGMHWASGAVKHSGAWGVEVLAVLTQALREILHMKRFVSLAANTNKDSKSNVVNQCK